MQTLVNGQMAACNTPKIAFIASEWTLAGMSALVNREMASCCKSEIAFVAGE